MSKQTKTPETTENTYQITEHNYNILQTQIMEIQNMLMRRDYHILIESAVDELSVTLRNAVTKKKQR